MLLLVNESKKNYVIKKHILLNCNQFYADLKLLFVFNNNNNTVINFYMIVLLFYIV